MHRITSNKQTLMARLLTTIMLALAVAMGLRAGTEVRITHFDESDGFDDSRVTCILQDHLGLIWLATWDGLYRYDGYGMDSFKARPGDNCPLPVNRIDSISELPDGNILCLAAGKLYTLNRRTGSFAPHKGPKPKVAPAYAPDRQTLATVASVPRYAGLNARVKFRDSQGGIWVSSVLGLDRLSFVSKPIGNRKYGTAATEEVRALMRDSHGRLWIADRNGYVRITTADGGVSYLTPSGRTAKSPAMFGPWIYCMHEDSRGRVWLGSKQRGIYLLTPAGGEYSVANIRAGNPRRGGLNHNSIYSFAEDAGGRIWVGTYGGGINVATVDARGRVSFANSDNGMKPLHKGDVEIHRLVITPQGILLAATNNGLYTARVERDARSMAFHAHRRDPANATSLSNNRVTDIVSMADGTVFVTTYGGGVCRALGPDLLADTLRFKPMTTARGLACDVITAAIEDKRGYLWLVSGASLSCLDPRKEVFTNFRQSTFAEGCVFSEAQPLLLPDGRLVIGTMQGTVEFNPAELKKSNFVPRIVTNCGESITLGPDNRRLYLTMAALDYNKNEQIEYAYRMDGIDDGWNYTTDNHIRYAALPPGTYTLRIRSTNGDGIWTDNERAITVSRRPRFSETPTAWMLYGGLIIIVAAAVLKLTAYVRRLQRELRHIKLTTNEKIEYVRLKTTDRMRTAPAPDSEPDKEQTHDKAWAAKVNEHMTANMANDGLSVDSFAQAMGMSRSAFYLNMKRVFGVTPNTFIQDARIEQAKRLLAGHEDNVSEVAYKCGFSDPKYFSRCFKKATGMSPSEYGNISRNAPKHADSPQAAPDGTN